MLPGKPRTFEVKGPDARSSGEIWLSCLQEWSVWGQQQVGARRKGILNESGEPMVDVAALKRELRSAGSGHDATGDAEPRGRSASRSRSRASSRGSSATPALRTRSRSSSRSRAVRPRAPSFTSTAAPSVGAIVAASGSPSPSTAPVGLDDGEQLRMAAAAHPPPLASVVPQTSSEPQQEVTVANSDSPAHPPQPLASDPPKSGAVSADSAVAPALVADALVPPPALPDLPAVFKDDDDVAAPPPPPAALDDASDDVARANPDGGVSFVVADDDIALEFRQSVSQTKSLVAKRASLIAESSSLGLETQANQPVKPPLDKLVDELTMLRDARDRRADRLVVLQDRIEELAALSEEHPEARPLLAQLRDQMDLLESKLSATKGRIGVLEQRLASRGASSGGGSSRPGSGALSVMGESSGGAGAGSGSSSASTRTSDQLQQPLQQPALAHSGKLESRSESDAIAMKKPELTGGTESQSEASLSQFVPSAVGSGVSALGHPVVEARGSIERRTSDQEELATASQKQEGRPSVSTGNTAVDGGPPPILPPEDDTYLSFVKK